MNEYTIILMQPNSYTAEAVSPEAAKRLADSHIKKLGKLNGVGAFVHSITLKSSGDDADDTDPGPERPAA